MNRGQIARGEFRAGNWQDRKASRQGCLGATVFPVGGCAHNAAHSQSLGRRGEGGGQRFSQGSVEDRPGWGEEKGSLQIPPSLQGLEWPDNRNQRAKCEERQNSRKGGFDSWSASDSDWGHRHWGEHPAWKQAKPASHIRRAEAGGSQRDPGQARSSDYRRALTD